MVEPQPSKLVTWVRFPSPAPDILGYLGVIAFGSCALSNSEIDFDLRMSS